MIRRIVSLTGFLSFVLLLLTSIVLYYQPHGRVAYWADWRLLGLGKEQWDALHISLGALFIVSGLVHVWYNWKAVTTYMKNKARELIILTPPMTAALVVTLYFTLGALWGWPGIQQLLQFSEYLKDGHVVEYGNPPYGHAELSTLDEFAGIMKLDVQQMVQALEEQGVPARPESTLLDLARGANSSPKELYDVIRSGLNLDPFAALPSRPPEGSGKLPLKELCNVYGLPWETVARRLREAGIEPTPQATLQKLADDHGVPPLDVYSILRTGTP